MASYFIFGAIGTCPDCGDNRFSGPITVAPDSSVTCHRCGHVATVADAVQTGLKAGTVKKLSDHRIVQNRPDRA
jgi:hypothetical protein